MEVYEYYIEYDPTFCVAINAQITLPRLDNTWQEDLVWSILDPLEWADDAAQR